MARITCLYPLGPDEKKELIEKQRTTADGSLKQASTPAFQQTNEPVKTNAKGLIIGLLSAFVLIGAVVVIIIAMQSNGNAPVAPATDDSVLSSDNIADASVSDTGYITVKNDFFALPYNGIAVINGEKKVNISYVEDIEWEKVDEALSWSNVAALSTGYKNLFGLCYDGTVAAAGSNEYGQCNVSNWKDVVLVDAGYEHTAALKSDGTAYAVGNNTDQRCDVQNWDHLIYVSAGRSNTVGLKEDGTVLVTGGNEWHQSEITDWHDIKMISAGYYHTVGLKSDGTVIAQGNNKFGQCSVEDWTDITAVYAGKMHTAALKKDGTVVATGHNDYGQCNVSEWKDVAELYVEKNYTVGKTSSGELLITGLCFYDDEISERKYYLDNYRSQLTP